MNKKGFTLIELLVVIAIIGVLASIALSSLSEARQRAREAKYIATIKQIETALELYNLDNGQYPAAGGVWGVNNNGTSANTTLATALAPYITVDFLDPEQFPQPTGASMIYRSVSANNYQTYALSLGSLTGYADLMANDGGYLSTTYELGEIPKYCFQNYTGANQAWRGSGVSSEVMCAGGN